MTQEQLLKPQELIERWRGIVCLQTIANWRAKGIGPKFVKVGHRVLYRLQDVEVYEQNRMKGV